MTILTAYDGCCDSFVSFCSSNAALIRQFATVLTKNVKPRTLAGYLRLVEGRMDGQEIQEVKEGEADLLSPAVA